MKSKHTPGPWHVRWPRRKSGLVLPPYIDGETRTDDTICRFGSGIVCYANADANAQLIAAAPELLKACDMAKYYFSEGDDLTAEQVLDATLAAIAKATGN